MPDSQTPNRRTQRRTKKGTSFSLIIIPALVLLLIIGGLWYILYMSSSTKTANNGEDLLDSSPSVTSPIEPPETRKPDSVEPPTATNTEEPLTSISDLPQLSEDIDIEPEPAVSPPVIKEEPPKDPCELAKEKLQTFFSALDREEYIRSFELENSSQNHFVALAEKLLQNPPVVVRESDDLYTMLRNMAHFFRIIGKKNITIIKTILDKERDEIEDVAAELYTWSVNGTCKADDFTLHADVSQLYEYAGFFLNTMGGRSYLFRRDSRSRLLVNYYSLLIIDQANKNGTNKHGIKIDPIISQLISEMESSNQLIYKEAYLDILYEMLERYQPEGSA